MSARKVVTDKETRWISEARAQTPSTGLDVVIVNWNAGSYLRSCLESVAATSRHAFDLRRVAVVDNASTDGSISALDDLPLPLQVFRNPVNRGFAAACNEGARDGEGDLILFLNPDTRLVPDTLDRVVRFMTDPENAPIGICGVQMIEGNGIEGFSCSRFPTLWIFVAKMLGLAHLFPQRIPRLRLRPTELRGSGIVDQVIGAFFLIRRPLFERLGGFDERFFVYFEDVDLAYRARLLGHPSYFLSDVPVFHAGNVSSGQVRGQRLFYHLRSRTEYARKHWPRWQAAVLIAMTVAVELPVRFIVAAARHRMEDVRDVGEATAGYLRYLVRHGAANSDSLFG